MNLKHCLALAAMILANTGAFAHAKLEASSPPAGTLVAPTLKEVRLQFNEPLEMAFSKITLIDPKGVAVGPLKVARDKSDPKAMIAALPRLFAGPYRVQWKTVTRDGHKVKGEFAFQVK